MGEQTEELLNRAIAALNHGEVTRAHSLAGEVLAADGDNADAADVLSTDVAPKGEIRRLTVMFCDLVGSTEMSERLEPEAYRTIVARFQRACRDVIEKQYEGYVVSLKGDGILAAFGFPAAHENDVDRAVRAGLGVVAAVEGLKNVIETDYGEQVGVRVAVHKGVVFLDLDERDLYGFAVNVASRLEGLAKPGTLLISDEVRRLVGDRFELQSHEPRQVKGVTSPLTSYTVLGEGVGVSHRASGPIFGRQAELERVAEAWARAKAGKRESGECVTLVGDAGIGKSRLAGALAELAEKDGASVVEIFGSPLETESGLWPIRRLIERHCGLVPDLDASARLQRLVDATAALDLDEAQVPVLATLVGIPATAGYAEVEADARLLRERIDDAVFRFVAALFGDGGGLLVSDDAHWFDDDTRSFVQRAASHLPPTVLTVVTSRDATAVPRGPRVVMLGLQPLTREDALDLVRGLQVTTRTHEALMAIVDRGDGVPLYLEELLRAADVDPSARPQVRGADPGSDVPEVLYELLVARLNVSADASTVAAAVATIVSDAGLELLAAATELKAGQISDAVQALVERRILERVDSSLDGYRFRHELLREAAYEMLPPSQRRVIHARVGDALVVAGGTHDTIEWQRVAGHFETAGRAGDAADAYEKASDQARRRGSLVEARSLLTRAVDLLVAARSSNAPRDARLRLERGYLALSLEGNQSPAAAADYEECLRLLVDEPVGDEMYGTILALWSYYAARAEFDRADELLAALRPSLAAAPPVIGALVEGFDATVGFYRGDHPRAQAASARQDQLMAQVGPEVDISNVWYVPLDPLVIAKTNDIGRCINVGDFAGALKLTDQARALSASLPFPRGPFTLAGFMGFESWFRAEVGDFDGAQAIVEEMADLSQRHGFDTWAMMANTQRDVYEGMRLLAQGGADHGPILSSIASTIGTFMTMWKMVDQYLFMSVYMTVQAQFHVAAGETEQAITALEEALAIGERTGMLYYQAETLRHLARLRPTPAERAAGFQEALTLARRQASVLYELNAAYDLAVLTDEVNELAATLPKFPASASFAALDAAREMVSRSSTST